MKKLREALTPKIDPITESYMLGMGPKSHYDAPATPEGDEVIHNPAGHAPVTRGEMREGLKPLDHPVHANFFVHEKRVKSLLAVLKKHDIQHVGFDSGQDVGHGSPWQVGFRTSVEKGKHVYDFLKKNELPEEDVPDYDEEGPYEGPKYPEHEWHDDYHEGKFTSHYEKG